MADRGRDLKVSILSDVDKFDLDKPAEELEQLGREAKTTSDKVDDAFEKIAHSSRSNLRKVKDDTDHAKKGLDEFKDEAHSSGREAAASFSGGFDDITDLVQETAANAFAGFGPVGAAAGIAAAAGIGFVINKIQESKQRVEELTQKFVDLAKQGIDPAKDSVDNLVDAMDVAELQKFKQQADDIGVSYDVMRDALDGNKEAINAVREAARRSMNDGGITGALFGGNTSAREVLQAMDETEAALNKSGDAIKFVGDNAKQAATDTETFNNAVLDGVSKQQEYAASVAGVESAIKRTGEAQSTFADDVKLSAGDVVKTLEEQTKAMLNYQKNLKVAAERGDADFLAWVEEQPANVAAAYASGTAKQRDAIYNAWLKNVGAAQGEGIVDGLDAHASAAEAAALRVRAAAKRGAMGDGPINIPTGVSPVPAYAISKVLRDVQNSMKPVTIPVMLQGVKQPTLSRYVP